MAFLFVWWGIFFVPSSMVTHIGYTFMCIQVFLNTIAVQVTICLVFLMVT